MTLLVILSCLLMQRFLGSWCWLTDEGLLSAYFRNWSRILASFGWLSSWRAPILRLLLELLPLAVVFFALGYFIESYLGVAGYFLWSLFWLWLCVDAYDPNWRHGDTLEASSNAAGYAATEEATVASVQQQANDDALHATAEDSSSSIQQVVATAVLRQAYRRIFVLLFYFALAGPFAMVLYRAVDFMAEDDSPSSAGARLLAADLQIILDWVPSRLLGLTYALVGHFAPSFRLCWQQFTTGARSQALLVGQWGAAALEGGKWAAKDHHGAGAARALVDRGLILWLVAFSVLTLMRL